MNPSDLFRLVVAIAAGVAAVMLLVRLNDDWPRLSHGWRVTRFGNIGLVFVFGYGAVEVIVTTDSVPLGLRVFMALGALLTITTGLFMVRNETGMGEGWIKASEVQDILDEVESAHSLGCNPPAPGCTIARDRLKVAIKKSRRRVMAG